MINHLDKPFIQSASYSLHWRVSAPFSLFFEGTSRRCCKWMKIKQRLCLLVWNQCSYTVGGNYRSYVWAFSSLMDSTCIWWINITVLKFYGLNYVYTIIFQEFKRKEIKVSSGLRNGSIFTQAASCLLTTSCWKWFLFEFFPLWSVNLLCNALDDSANQIVEGRVILIDSEL